MLGEHAWQGCAWGVCGMHDRGHVCRGACMLGGVHAREMALKRAVCILLECILVYI